MICPACNGAKKRALRYTLEDPCTVCLGSGRVPDEGMDLGGLVKSQAEIMSKIKKAETHCFALSRECIRESKAFKRIDIHYENKGLVVTYRCSYDDRLYDVTIIPKR